MSRLHPVFQEILTDWQAIGQIPAKKELSEKWLKEVFVMEKTKEFQSWLEEQIKQGRLSKINGKFYLSQTSEDLSNE